MILFFSGTGNSEFAAKTVASVTGDEVVSINEMIKNRRISVFKSEKPFVFVAPTYSWRIPRVMEEFIRNNTFEGSKDAYFILTCGENTGGAVDYAKKISEEKKFNFKGLSSVVMPNNYVAFSKMATKEFNEELIDKAEKNILKLAVDIKDENDFPKEKREFASSIKSGLINSLFYKSFVSAKGFYSTDECISCGKCKKICSLNNIKLQNGRPVWGDNCTHCMACIAICPKTAIEYKKNTKGKERYYNPRV